MKKTLSFELFVSVALLSQVWPSLSFSIAPSVSSTTSHRQKHNRCAVVLNGVLSRAAIMNASSSSKNKSPQRKKKKIVEENPHLTKNFLVEVVDEALFRQHSAMEAVDREIERRQEMEENEDRDGDDESALANDISNRMESRRRELRDLDSKLKGLRDNILNSPNLSQQKMEGMKAQIVNSGYGGIFHQSPSSWKSKQALQNQYGRPHGFDGDVYYSPLGVPILVGRMKAHKDEVMRNAAQGSDLWFQVEDYNGSRVLLRTSLMKGTSGSKACMQMAADLAARYSVWGAGTGGDQKYDSVPVMYTDSRKVAKRGGRVGQMKQKKSLGRIMGMPQNA